MCSKPKVLLIAPHHEILTPFQQALEEKAFEVHTNSFSYQRNRQSITEVFDLVVIFWETQVPSKTIQHNRLRSFDAIFIKRGRVVSESVEIFQNGVYPARNLEKKIQVFVETVKKLLEKEQPKPESNLNYDPLVGRSWQMIELKKKIKKLCQHPEIPVLITGETGTGKELVARMLHCNSLRASKPFIPVNCSAITETLLESQLFGHKKGAFTGATEDYTGLFEQADSGTILLDEIGEMPLHVQPKLLRFLEDFRLKRVGSTEEKQLNVWVLSSTNINLEDALLQNRFRQDLYYRLFGQTLIIAPLRERREDIPDLIQHFLRNQIWTALPD